MDEITVLRTFIEGRDYEREQEKSAPSETERDRAAIRARLFDVLVARQVERIEWVNEADMEAIEDLVERNRGILLEAEGGDGRKMRFLYNKIEARTLEVRHILRKERHPPKARASAAGRVGVSGKAAGAVSPAGTAMGRGTVGGR